MAKDFASILQKNGLPPAPSAPVDARWIATNGDWWILTEDGWFWARTDTATIRWVKAPNGPP
jgi:hypothetical protein